MNHELFMLEMVIVLGVSVFLFYVASQTALLRRVTLYVAAGYALGIGLNGIVFLGHYFGHWGIGVTVSIAAVITLLATVFFLLAGIENVQNVVNGMNELRHVLDEISRGHFDVDLSPELLQRNDELGEVAVAFNRMMTSLKLAVRQSSTDIQNELDTISDKLKDQERYEKLFLEIPIPYFFVDGEGVIQNANDAAAALLQRSREDMIGTLTEDSETERGREQTDNLVEKILAGQETVDAEIEVRDPEGGTMVLTVHATPVIEDETIIGVHTIVTDVQRDP